MVQKQQERNREKGPYGAKKGVLKKVFIDLILYECTMMFLLHERNYLVPFSPGSNLSFLVVDITLYAKKKKEKRNLNPIWKVFYTWL